MSASLSSSPYSRTGGDDLTENWTLGTPAPSAGRSGSGGRKRKHSALHDAAVQSQPAAEPSATAALPRKRRHRGRGQTTPSPSPSCPSTAEEAAALFSRLYAASGRSEDGARQAAESSAPALTASQFVCPPSSPASVSLPARPLSGLCHDLKCLMPQWRSSLTSSSPSSSGPSRPYLVIICASALRCIEFVRALRPLQARVLKAFARHIRIEQQTEQLRSADVRILVGTPRRLSDLLGMAAFELQRAAVCLLDAAHDAKRFSLLTQPTVSSDLFTLYAQHLQGAVRAGAMRLCIY